MSSNLLSELVQLDTTTKELEKQAQAHEQAQRKCREGMAEAKLKASELRRIINEAAVVTAVESSLATAKAAQATVEASNVEIGKVLESLKLKELLIDGKLKELDAKLAGEPDDAQPE